MKPKLTLLLLATIALTGGAATAQNGRDPDAAALALARKEAREADLRSRQLESAASAATNEAAKARAESGALAARIEGAEAEITAAETKIRMLENLRAEQRARLAERQEPVVRLTAALQTMARRPPALALVQPGTLEEIVRVRALLASTLPIIRARTAALREEVKAGNELRRKAEAAVAALVQSQERLKERRIELARFETKQRARSRSLIESAMYQSDRALALGEDARDLARLLSTKQEQARTRSALEGLPGPTLRPGSGQQKPPPQRPFYLLPVQGAVVTGMGEISDAGVHARGVTFEPVPGAQIIAPRDGRVAYASRFRNYGTIVIIDHGDGWTSLITNLDTLRVRVGQQVARGAAIGTGGTNSKRVTVELRRQGRPFPITPLIATS